MACWHTDGGTPVTYPGFAASVMLPLSPPYDAVTVVFCGATWGYNSNHGASCTPTRHGELVPAGRAAHGVAHSLLSFALCDPKCVASCQASLEKSLRSVRGLGLRGHYANGRQPCIVARHRPGPDQQADHELLHHHAVRQRGVHDGRCERLLRLLLRHRSEPAGRPAQHHRHPSALCHG